MARTKKHAVVYLRMSPQLRDGLQNAADAAGCSLNSFAMQVLAAAAGHNARFRGTADTGPAPDEREHELRTMPRDTRGFPVGPWSERQRHGSARQNWVYDLERAGADFSAIMRLLNELDAERPWHYVEWRELNGPRLPVGRVLAGLSDVA